MSKQLRTDEQSLPLSSFLDAINNEVDRLAMNDAMDAMLIARGRR